MSDIDTILKRLDSEIDGIRYAIKYTNAIAERGLAPLLDYAEKKDEIESNEDGSNRNESEAECAYRLRWHIDLDRESVDEHVKIMKSSCLLMLYCICESIICEAMDYVDEYIDEHSKNDLHYDMCSEPIKKILLGRLIEGIMKENQKKVEKITKLASYSESISNTLMRKWGVRNYRYYLGGNIDAKTTNALFKKYGISEIPGGSKFFGVSELIKDCRNSLSHGEKSFLEVGRDIGMEELLENADHIHEMLKKSLENIKQYIDSREYQKDNTTS